LQALQFGRTLGFGKCANGLLLSQLEIPCNSSVFLTQHHLRTLWFKNNKLIEKDQQVEATGYSSVTTTECFLSEILNMIGAYKINTAL